MLTRRFFLDAGGAAPSPRFATANGVRPGEHRPALRLHHPARRRRRPVDRRADRRSAPRGLRGEFDQDLAPERSSTASSRCIRRSPRPPAVCSEAGAVRPRGRLALSRPLAFRRAERARDRRVGCLPAEGRLAQPLARPPARRRIPRRSPSPTPFRWRCAATTRCRPTRRRSCRGRATTCSSASSRSTKPIRSFTRLWSEAVATRMTAGDVEARRPKWRGDRRARGQAPGRRIGRAHRDDRDQRLGHPLRPARPA